MAEKTNGWYLTTACTKHYYQNVMKEKRRQTRRNMRDECRRRGEWFSPRLSMWVSNKCFLTTGPENR